MPGKESPVEPAALLLLHAGDHFHPCLPEAADTLSCYKGVGIDGADHHPSYAASDYQVSTGRRSPVMRAGLEADIDG